MKKSLICCSVVEGAVLYIITYKLQSVQMKHSHVILFSEPAV